MLLALSSEGYQPTVRRSSQSASAGTELKTVEEVLPNFPAESAYQPAALPAARVGARGVGRSAGRSDTPPKSGAQGLGHPGLRQRAAASASSVAAAATCSSCAPRKQSSTRCETGRPLESRGNRNTSCGTRIESRRTDLQLIAIRVQDHDEVRFNESASTAPALDQERQPNALRAELNSQPGNDQIASFSMACQIYCHC